MPVPREFIEWE